MKSNEQLGQVPAEVREALDKIADKIFTCDGIGKVKKRELLCAALAPLWEAHTKDSERYRHLRAHWNEFTGITWREEDIPHELDSAVDAEIEFIARNKDAIAAWAVKNHKITNDSDGDTAMTGGY